MDYSAIGHAGLKAQEDAKQRLRDALLVDIKESCTPGESTQFHHLIPIDTWDKDPVIKELGWRERKDLRESPRNKMELPSTYLGAVASGLAMHSGNHKAYTDHVKEELEKIGINYTAHHSGDKIWLAQQVEALQGELRQSLDRAYAPVVQQTFLNASDPLMPIVAVSHLVGKPETPELEAAVKAYEQDPRKGFPHDPKAMECGKELVTVGQAQAIGQDLRGRAWGGVDQPPVPAVAALSSPEPTLTERAQHTVYGAMQYAANHAPEIAAGGVLIGLAIAAAPVELTAAAMVGGGALMLHSNSAEAAPLSDEKPVSKLPSLSQLNGKLDGQADIMGARSGVDHIAWRFTGYPAGDPRNSLAALHARDTDPARPGGFLMDTGAHYLLKADGTLVSSEAHSRPLHQNPQIAAGNNANALGVYVEGDGRITPEQRQTLTHMNADLSQQWQSAGKPHMTTLVPATYQEHDAWGNDGLKMPGIASVAPTAPQRSRQNGMGL